MKTLPTVAGMALFACSWAGLCQSEVSCGQTIEAPLRPGTMLTIDSRPAGIEIVATDQETIHVSCTTDESEGAKNTRLKFSGSPAQSKLTVVGPHLKNGSVQIRVEVPRKTNLNIRMPAGQVKVDEIVGDKDIELYAGQITITSAHKWDYKKIDVSVGVGQVSARAYGVDKGGFFRSFHKESAGGEYRAYAHVTSGQIELLGKSASAATDPQ